MNLKFLKSSAKKKFLDCLREQYGISNLPFLLMETGKEKIRGFSGSMSKEEILELSEIANVEVVGLYLFKSDGTLRLGLDGTHILKKQISKNILKITKEELGDWLRGRDIEKEIDRGIWVIDHDGDFVGCGLSDGMRIINHVPKERRIRSSLQHFKI